MRVLGVKTSRSLPSLAISAVLATLASAAQAAVYSVDVSGTETITTFYGDDCLPPDGCVNSYSLEGTHLIVTTPTAGDGVFTSGVTLSYSSGVGYSGDAFDFSGSGIEVDVFGDSLSIFGTIPETGLTFEGGTFVLQFGSPSLSEHIDAWLGPASLVPEPASASLMGGALAAMAWVGHRRRRRQVVAPSLG